MKKRKSIWDRKVITPAMVEQATKRRNFDLALEKLCDRMGETRNFFRLIRRRDPDATLGEIAEFRRKMVRLLAFNYDVHRCPDPVHNKKLYGTEPLRYPPEWSKA